jgi:Spy/CpxP family protein refolding chaperone
MTDKRKAIILVIVLFVLGIALGAVGTHMWDAHVVAAQAHHSFIRDLKAELQMTPAQEKQFDAIIKDDHSKLRALTVQRNAEWDPKYEQVHRQARQNIRAILTPDQRAKFDAFLKRIDQAHEK